MAALKISQSVLNHSDLRETPKSLARLAPLINQRAGRGARSEKPNTPNEPNPIFGHSNPFQESRFANLIPRNPHNRNRILSVSASLRRKEPAASDAPCAPSFTLNFPCKV